MPVRKLEVALHGRQADVDRAFKVSAVKRAMTDGGNCERPCQGWCLADGVGGVAKSHLGIEAPSCRRERHGEMRIKVKPAYVARVKERFGAVEVAEGRTQSPVERRASQGPVKHVIAQQWQVQDLYLIAVRSAGKRFKAVKPGRWHPAVAVVRQRHVAGHLRAGGLRVIVVEDQPIDVVRQVLHGTCDARGRRKVLAAHEAHIHSTLVDKLIADRAREQAGTLCVRVAGVVPIGSSTPRSSKAFQRAFR